MKIQSLAAIVLCATGCESQFMELPATTRLYINRADSLHYSITKSKESGEKDLERLVNFSSYEEAWIFDGVNSRWLELGKDEKLTSVEYDRFKIMSNPDKITLYHIHPIKSLWMQLMLFEEVSTELEMLKKQKNNPEINADIIKSEEEKLKLQAEMIAASFPSTIDIITAAKWKNAFKVENNTVATMYGLIDYFSTTEKKDIITDYKKFIYVIAGISLANGKTEVAAINEIISQVNNRYDEKIKLNFRPYSE